MDHNVTIKALIVRTVGSKSERGHSEDSLMCGEGLGLIHIVIRPRALSLHKHPFEGLQRRLGKASTLLDTSLKKYRSR